ncbi:MAG: hypothetical protein ACI4A3_06210, partial [Lachnospiraceae bacterium]
RMISAQLETEFTDSDYDNIKKVYSIWICMDVPRYAENTITAYEIAKRDIVGIFPEKKTRYDLMTIITICLSSELAEAKEELNLHRLLGALLSPELNAGEKKEILTREYHIPMRKEFERSVNCMCNLAEGIEEKAEKRGEKRGERRGERRGGVLALNQIGYTAERIAQELSIPIKTVNDILTEAGCTRS